MQLGNHPLVGLGAALLPLLSIGAGGSPQGDHSQYVVDSIVLPTTAAQATQLGLDLNDDPLARVDNALGQVLSALAGSANLDPQPTMDDLTHRGEVILLADLQAPSLADAACAGLRIATARTRAHPRAATRWTWPAATTSTD